MILNTRHILLSICFHRKIIKSVIKKYFRFLTDFPFHVILQYVQEEDVKFIRLTFCNVFGRQKNVSIEEKMEEIRLVNRAKWLLIDKQNMDEPSAHRRIEKQAMDQCVTRREIAEAIIRSYSKS